jgi:transcriptional regulator with XRE-family HTH domain
MGQHVFGKRCRKGGPPPIVRAVPALVAESVWQAAQRVLHAHRGGRACAASQPFLLRGLIHCGRCGLLYSGMRQRGPQPGHSYRCNGRQFAHALYGSREHQCAGKNLPGGLVDGMVWAEVQSFLRQPQQILARLRQRVKLSEVERQRREQELSDRRAQRRDKGVERERMLGLFRRGRIDEATLDRHLNVIDTEAAALQAAITAAERALSDDERTAQLHAAEKLLGSLRAELDEPLTPVAQRQMVEALVEKIEVGTVERWGVPQTAVTVTYRFTPAASAEPLVLPLVHTLHSRGKMPEKAATVGDHLHRRRLQLGMLQRQVAEQLGVEQGTIYNWEKNRCQPRVQHMPAVVQFLGYTPAVATDRWAARLLQGRKAMGLSQKEAARQMGVVQCTLARWERGEREPEGENTARAQRFLQAAETAKPAAAGAGRA